MFECILYIYIRKKSMYEQFIYQERLPTIQNDKIEKFCRALIKKLCTI